MDGLLVIDKPAGPTSHDVIVRMRRALKERRIGHTGTLDPAATGVLLLVVGRATRLARFLSSADKQYEAVVRLGVSTDTADAAGEPIGTPYAGALPGRGTIDAALDAFRGTFLQRPPAFSAKKVGGTRSHRLARADRAPVHEPVSVTARAIDLVGVDRDRVTLRVDCSAGFYVRSLAHDLGQRLGTGAHLIALRRTRSGDYTLDDALGLDVAERDARESAGRLIPLARMLPRVAALTLNTDGVRRAINGCLLGPADVVPPSQLHADAELIRMLDAAGNLVAIGRPAAGGLLHPSVVLM